MNSSWQAKAVAAEAAISAAARDIREAGERRRAATVPLDAAARRWMELDDDHPARMQWEGLIDNGFYPGPCCRAGDANPRENGSIWDVDYHCRRCCGDIVSVPAEFVFNEPEFLRRAAEAAASAEGDDGWPEVTYTKAVAGFTRSGNAGMLNNQGN